MKCEQAMESITAEVAGERLTDGEAVEAHLAVCAACRVEAARARELWKGLALLDEEPPSERMRARFEGMLAGYRDAASDATSVREAGAGAVGGATPSPGAVTSTVSWLAARWPRRPAVQIAATLAACLASLAIGLVIGAARAAPSSEPDLARLEAEVQSLNELVALSLLDDDSASERLAGVGYSARLARPDAQVVTTLMQTAVADPSANVRLAAVDALAPMVDRPKVLPGLIAAVRGEPSPLVQVALVDLLLTSESPEARDAVASLLDDPGIDEDVKRYVRRRLGETT